MDLMVAPTLFALGFANLPLLYGLAAASLPVIIHLLNKRKYQVMAWAAMQFLLAAVKKNQRKIRIEQWLLLLVRTLVIVFAVLALAQPFLESMGAVPLLPGRRTHSVLVLDGSMSMAYAPAETSRFEQAKLRASELVRSARRGKSFSLVLMADPPQVLVGEPTSNPDAILSQIDDLVLPHGTVDLSASFQAIAEVLQASNLGQKEVIVLTDFQAATWNQPESDSEEALRQPLETLASLNTRSVVIDLARSDAPNHAITAMALDAPVITTGTEQTLQVRVQNHARTDQPGVRLRMSLDGRPGPETRLDLSAGGERIHVFPVTFERSGEHVLEVQLDADGLSLDDARRLVVPVREALNVVVVDGDRQPGPFRSDSDYLVEAISPSLNDPDQADWLVQPEVVPESEMAFVLQRVGQAAPDVLVLCNVAQFSPAEVDVLRQHLARGGGLVVFGGDQVLADNYNRLLAGDEDRILPAAIGETIEYDVAEDSGQQGSSDRPRLDPLEFRHPIVQDFAGQEEAVLAGLTSVKTSRYHQLQRPEDTTSMLALAFDNGDPAVLVEDVGDGVVVQVATTADTDWTDWPVHLSYAPVMERMVIEAARRKLARRNVRVGRPLVWALPEPTDLPAQVRTPIGQSLPVPVRRTGFGAEVVFPVADPGALGVPLSGLYQVELGSPGQEGARRARFAVNIDPLESDLRRIDPEALDELVPGWSPVIFENTEGIDANTVSRQGELHRPLLFALLALILVETLLAWNFGRHAASVRDPAPGNAGLGWMGRTA